MHPTHLLTGQRLRLTTDPAAEEHLKAQAFVAVGVIEADQGLRYFHLDHYYSHKRLRFEVFLCRWISGEPQPLASQQVRWVHPTGLAAFPFPAANARIIAALLQRFGHSEESSKVA